jgi:hypothetical protein
MDHEYCYHEIDCHMRLSSISTTPVKDYYGRRSRFLDVWVECTRRYLPITGFCKLELPHNNIDTLIFSLDYTLRII